MLKLERNIVYSFPLVSILCDIAKSFLGAETKIIAIRNGLFFLIMVYMLVKYFRQAVKINTTIIIILIYLTIELIATSAKVEQYNDLIRAMICKLLLPIGFIITSTYDDIKILNKRLFITNILFIISIIIFSILKIGENPYGGDSGFYSGMFTFSNIYIGSYLVIMLPLTYYDFKDKISKHAVPVVAIFTMIILVLSVRRTSIVLVLIAAFVYMYLYRDQLHRFVGYAVALLVVMVITFPLYQGILMKQLEARSDTFNDEGVAENLQGETRLVETVAVYHERIMNPDLKIFLFGQHLFDSPGNYDYGIHKGRPLHLDLNVMLHGAGIIGFGLIALFYVEIFTKYLAFKRKLELEQERLLIGCFLGMFFSHVFLLLSGGMLTVTFNVTSFLYMGAIMGLFKSAKMATAKPSLYGGSKSTNTVDSKPIVRKSFVYEPRNN